MSDNNNTLNTMKHDYLASCFSTIKLLRFPLSLLVVFMHGIFVCNVSNIEESSINGERLYSFISVFLSQYVCGCLVPTFFVMSGYLFFINIEKLSIGVYKNKIKARFFTLFLPYCFWNIIKPLIQLCHSLYIGKSIDFPIQRILFVYASSSD